MKGLLMIVLGALVILFILIQLVPQDHTNPEITREIQWDSPQTRALAKRACFDCHSNETVWPWYSNVAPVSFVLSGHIAEGRESLNFSEWNRGNEDFEEVQEVIQKGEMPLWDYLLMHPEAKLTAAEKEQLLSGLQNTFQQDPPIERERKERGAVQ